MRPRHKAAENLQPGRHVAVVRPASMRPRHKAAENGHRAAGAVPGPAASMRPRHKAAENAEVSYELWLEVEGLQ